MSSPPAGAYGGDLGVRHGNLWIKRSELQMLLVLLRAVVAAGEREDQRSSPCSWLSRRGVLV